MRRKTLKLNSEILFYGKKHKVIAYRPPNIVLQRSDGDLDTFEINLEKLVNDPGFSGGQFLVKEDKRENKTYYSTLDSLPEHKREKVSEKYELIHPLLVFEKAKGNEARAMVEFMDRYKHLLKEGETVRKVKQETIIRRICELHKVSRAQLFRYLRDYREHEQEGNGLEGLVRKTDKEKGERKDTKHLEICHPKTGEVLDVLYVRRPIEYHPIIKEVIEKEYLTTKRITIKAAEESIRTRCHKVGIPPIPYISVNKLISQLSQRTIAMMRDGKKFDEFEDVDRGVSNELAKYPLHVVQIDHTKLDILVVEEKTRRVIGRPWLTLGIDVYSRMIWCMHLSIEEPSANKVRKAIEHGIFFKNARERYGTENEWEIFGIPSIIYLDNGTDFRSNAVRRLINETLKSEVRYRPVATPRYGGVIERLFGSINKKVIHKLPGTTKSNVGDKGDYDSESEAVLTIADLTKILAIYFTDVYHYEEHSSLPKDAPVPVIRYREGLEQWGIPEWVAKEDEEMYRMELLPTLMKPYTKDGVRYDNIFYKSSQTSYLIGKREVKYKIKYDDDDISKIYLQLPDSLEYVELRAVRPSFDELENMNRYTWRKIQEYIRQEGESKVERVVDTEKVQKAKQKIEKQVEKAQKHSTRTRRIVEKMGVQISLIPMNQSITNSKHPSITNLLEMAKLALQEEEA